MPQRLEPYLGVLVAFTLVFIISLLPNAVRSPVLSQTRNASSTIVVVSDVTLPSTIFPTIATTTQAPTAASKKVSAPTPKPKQAVTEPPSAPVTPVTTPSFSSADLETAGASLRSALVNVLCYAPAGTRLHSMSGSGVIIDSKGIILTNAHIAQYFLLLDQGVSCSVRSGSPAIDRYDAALIYIPSSWIKANARVLTTDNPIGTGEEDFALLAVTKSRTSSPLPVSFPAIPLANNAPHAGAPIVIASYGAQFLESIQVQFALFPTIVFGNVKDVYTFASTTIDVLALGGSAAAQEGSSGGGVTGVEGTLLGTITTSTVKGDTATRSLEAITATYISRIFANETGSSLDNLLNKSTETAVSDFAPNIPALEAILTANLP